MPAKIHLERQIDQITTVLLRMVSGADTMLAECVQAFLERNVDLAKKVMDDDDSIDHLDNVVDEKCLEILALEQPVAVDLRYVVAAMRLTVNLERIADEACNIAGHTIELTAIPPSLPHPVMREFCRHALAMYRASVESFRSGDVPLARKVCDMEEQADSYYAKAVHTCFAELSGEVQSTQISLFRIFISRALERICDLSTNIAEITVFAYEGSVIKHHWQQALAESREK